MLKKLKEWARMIKRDIHALYLASRDPGVPWHAKAVALFVAGYAISPIDLIPDFIPVLGLLDDAVLLPIGIYIAIRLVPPPIMAECRARAAAASERPVSRVAAALIILLWLLAAWLIMRLLLRWF